MIHYIICRILIAIPTLLAISFIIFAILHQKRPPNVSMSVPVMQFCQLVPPALTSNILTRLSLYR